jgi:hypothetical protein
MKTIQEGKIVTYYHARDGHKVKGKVIGVSYSVTGAQFAYVDNWANRVLIADILGVSA